MILKLKPELNTQQRDLFISFLQGQGIDFLLREIYGMQLCLIFSDIENAQMVYLSSLPFIEEVVDTPKEYLLASNTWKKSSTCFDVEGQIIGGKEINIIAGPCSVESEEQIFKIAEHLHSLGLKFIRGGAYKPRTSPYRFQGLGIDGLKYIRKAADAYDLRVVTEVIDSSLIPEVSEYADILQVGSRNMQNYYFLKQLGKINKPVLLKRGMYARIDEWLMAAEYILSAGNEKVILCERGIRTFDTSVRNTMDITAFPLIKSLSHLPVFSDPSHGTGIRNLVTPLALASVAAGADGIMVEIHPDPDKALSDGMQSLYLEQFTDLINKARQVAAAINRSLDNDSANDKQKKQNICVE